MLRRAPSRSIFLAAAIACPLTTVSTAQAPMPRSAPPAAAAQDETAFRDLYRQLIEINTTRSVGRCPSAAEAMRARLPAAGIPASDTQILAPPDRPKDGALIAVLHGRDRMAKPI